MLQELLGEREGERNGVHVNLLFYGYFKEGIQFVDEGGIFASCADFLEVRLFISARYDVTGQLAIHQNNMSWCPNEQHATEK